MNVLLSIVYVLSYVLSLTVIVSFPKSGSPVKALTLVPVSFFLLLSYDGLAAGACTLLGVPVNLVSQLAGHVLLIGVGLSLIRRHGRTQRLLFTRGDAVTLAVILVVAAIVVFFEFGPDFTPHYIVTDAINHLRQSLYILYRGTVTNMYQAWNFIATALGVSSAFVRFDLYYKVYCLCDILFWILGCLLFYGVACSMLRSSRRELIAGIFSVLYFLGYPLTGIVWGFCYLGVGVSFAVLSIYFCTQASSSRRYALLGLGISLYGLVTSYALFAPFVFLVALVSLLRAGMRRDRCVSPRTLATLALVLVLPGLLGSWFFYDGILSSGEVTVASALDNEGGMYRNLYSNLVLFAPLIIVTIWVEVKGRTIASRPETLAVVILVLSVALMLVPTYLGILSTYYLGKMQFAIWPFALMSAAKGAQSALRLPGRVVLGAYASVFAFLSLMILGRFDQGLREAYQPIDPGVASAYHPYLDVYRWNLESILSSAGINPDVWELCHRASDLVEDGEEVPVLAAYMYGGWYCDVTSQLDEVRQIRVDRDGPGEAVEKVLEGQYSYVTVIPIPYADQGDEGAEEASGLVLAQEGVEVVYENDAGYIARLP